jgi:hypothetical protein
LHYLLFTNKTADAGSSRRTKVHPMLAGACMATLDFGFRPSQTAFSICLDKSPLQLQPQLQPQPRPQKQQPNFASCQSKALLTFNVSFRSQRLNFVCSLSNAISGGGGGGMNRG